MILSVKSIILILCICLIVPYILGLIWTRHMKKTQEQNSIALSVVMGVLTMFSLYLIPAIPMIVFRQSFRLLTQIWVVEIILFLVYSILRNYYRFGSIIQNKREAISSWLKRNWFIKLLTCTFISLIIMQALLLSYASIYDTDDARYIAESLDAIRTDKMLLTHPLTGEDIDAPVGEMTKDVVCPFPMLLASISVITGIHTATLCHVVLPLFLIPLCYLIYWLLSAKIFGEESIEKKVIFMVFICVLMMFGRLSAFWSSAYLLWRIWQGKAMLNAILLPFLFWIMQSILQDLETKEYDMLLFILTLGSSILSPMSAIFNLLIIGMYTTLMIFCNKKWYIALRMGICCLPIAAFVVMTKITGMVRINV